MMAAASKLRKVLTLKEKVEVITKNPGSGSRKVASVFNCGKIQIHWILKNRKKSGKSSRRMAQRIERGTDWKQILKPYTDGNVWLERETFQHSALENAKVSATIRNATQTLIMDFMNNK